MRSSSDTRHWPEREGLDARMTTVAAAVAGATLASGVYSANKQSKAADRAAAAQQSSADAGIQLQADVAREQMGLQQRQFDIVQNLLSPYVNSGQAALRAQTDLLGMNSPSDQAAAVSRIANSSQFNQLVKAGENSILQNASATGGLRGGNTQGALADFRANTLNSLIEQQYAKYGDLARVGQNSAVGVGNAGQSMANSSAQIAGSSANNQTALLGQLGAAQAGNALAQGRAQAGYANAITGALGTYVGMGGKF